ncbi:MAG: hypothetical protein AAF493_05510 [Pseudomonadota bacterium]
MIVNVILAVVAIWTIAVIGLFALKGGLFRATWREPYLDGVNVVIESDDWGPGGDFHIERLADVMNLMTRHRDSLGRPAVFTADMILSVPDLARMEKEGYQTYHRAYLQEAFPELADAFRHWVNAGVLMPQFHGLEHCNGPTIRTLATAGDERVPAPTPNETWWDWETLDSPLQGHYVDGGSLPTTPVDDQRQAEWVRLGIEHFSAVFGFRPTSAVAPCYLWNDTTEAHWHSNGVEYIQTAGYRCSGRDHDGTYQQDRPWIVFGACNERGQIYLVRNTMFEPTDGRGVDDALKEAASNVAQGLPVSISTHRYNYTRSEAAHQDSMAQFDRLLDGLSKLGRTRFLSSPELGAAVKEPHQPIVSPGLGESWPPLTQLASVAKLGAFLCRLWFRHQKLRQIAALTGLVIPGYVLVQLGRAARSA